jgi:hypothetical protein
MNIPQTTLLEEMGFRSDDAALQTRVDEESTKLDVKEATTQTTLVTSQIMPLEENDVVQESVYSPSPSLDDAEDVAFLEQFLVSKHESIPPDKFTLHVPELNRSTFDDTMELIPPFFYDGGVDRAHLPPPSFPSRCQNDEDGRCGSTTIASGGGIQEETIRINYDQINSADVLCGQGSGAITHCGNLAFRSWIAQYQPLYRSACPVKRAEIAEGIIDEIKKKGGRFLKRAGTKSEGNTQSWIDIGWKAAVDKTRQALREKIPAALLEPTSKNKKDDVTEEEERTWLPTTSPLASITSTPHFALLSGSLGIFEDDVLLGRGGITNEHSK